MTGTIRDVTAAMRRMPPMITSAISAASTSPLTQVGMLKEASSPDARLLLCGKLPEPKELTTVAMDRLTGFVSGGGGLLLVAGERLSRAGALRTPHLEKRAATFFYRKFVINDLPFLLLYYQPNAMIYFLADRLTAYNVYVILAGIGIFILTSFFP